MVGSGDFAGFRGFRKTPGQKHICGAQKVLCEHCELKALATAKVAREREQGLKGKLKMLQLATKRRKTALVKKALVKKALVKKALVKKALVKKGFDSCRTTASIAGPITETKDAR